MVRFFKCRRGKHDYGSSSGYVRKCKVCEQEQYLVGRIYPRIGQAKYFWKDKAFTGYYGKKKWDKFIQSNKLLCNFDIFFQPIGLSNVLVLDIGVFAITYHSITDGM